LFHALGKTPPSVATAPSNAFNMKTARATAQPPLTPEETLRQL